MTTTSFSDSRAVQTRNWDRIVEAAGQFGPLGQLEVELDRLENQRKQYGGDVQVPLDWDVEPIVTDEELRQRSEHVREALRAGVGRYGKAGSSRCFRFFMALLWVPAATAVIVWGPETPLAKALAIGGIVTITFLVGAVVGAASAE